MHKPFFSSWISRFDIQTYVVVHGEKKLIFFMVSSPILTMKPPMFSSPTPAVDAELLTFCHHQSACLSYVWWFKQPLGSWIFHGISKEFPIFYRFPWDFPIFHGIFHGISKVTTVIKRKAWAPKWFRSPVTRGRDATASGWSTSAPAPWAPPGAPCWCGRWWLESRWEKLGRKDDGF